MEILLMTVLVLLVVILLWALSGNREGETAAPAPVPAQEPRAPEDKLPPEQTFRRRAADKEIEEETSRFRRREDQPLLAEGHEVEDDFDFPYPPEEIIPPQSRLKVFRRTLMNAEAYARRGDFTTAISLFEGVKARVGDREVKFRIEADIDYLQEYRNRRKGEIAQKRKRPQQPQANEVKFSIDGQIPQVVNIGVTDATQKVEPEKIAEMVTRQLRQELDDLKKAAAPVEEKKTGEDEHITAMKEQLADLKRNIDHLNNEKNRALEQMDYLRREKENRDRDEIERVRREIGEINTLRKELSDLSRKLTENLTRIPEAPPVMPEARFTLDASPILEILEKIPKAGTPPPPPEPEPVEEIITRAEETEEEIRSLDSGELLDFPDRPLMPDEEQAPSDGSYPEELRERDLVILDEPPSGEAHEEMEPLREEEILPLPEEPPVIEDEFPLTAGEMKSATAEIPEEEPLPAPAEGKAEPAETPAPAATEEVRTIREEVERKEVEEDDFELVKELGRADQQSKVDELSDEEIFERILRDTKPKVEEDTSFEILGDRRDQGEFDIIDKEEEQRRREEEDFYRKFLKSDKMKKRELPILKVTYDFTKLPHEMSLSKEKNIIEYSFYKYRPMLEKADEFIKKRKVKDAINYYKVVMGQNIPPEFKAMLRRNINDLTDYLERYLTGD